MGRVSGSILLVSQVLPYPIPPPLRRLQDEPVTIYHLWQTKRGAQFLKSILKSQNRLLSLELRLCFFSKETMVSAGGGLATDSLIDHRNDSIHLDPLFFSRARSFFLK